MVKRGRATVGRLATAGTPLVAWLATAAACQRGGATTSASGERVNVPPAVSSADPPPSVEAVSSGEEGGVAGAIVASAGVDAAAPSANPFPFGLPAPIDKYACPAILPGGAFRSFLAGGDARVAFVDGDDWLALVNRSPTGALSPAYAPTDLVDVRDLSPHSSAQCDSGRNCLRRDAAVALRSMLDAMKAAGVAGRVESAFRGFGTQCWVFQSWAEKAHAGFCEATTQSALPGHSQHQLGTTVDLFTAEWANTGKVFRDGFGCTPGGKWLDDNAWTYGFVLPYPIDPDDRKAGSRCAPRWDHVVPIDPKTGYKHEPWHLRFVGTDAAARFHEAWVASGPETPREITLEQWLRGKRELVGDSELPVCDGCQCGACATMAADGDKTPCGDASLQLDASGRVVSPAEAPRLLDAAIAPAKDGVTVVDVKVRAAAHTPTQPPVVNEKEPTYGAGASFAALAPYPDTQAHRYDDLPGAWRVAIEPSPAGDTRWPWRASLAKPQLEATWNRANIVLPAKAGDTTVRVRVALPAGCTGVRVTLLRDGAEHETRELPVPQ